MRAWRTRSGVAQIRIVAVWVSSITAATAAVAGVAAITLSGLSEAIATWAGAILATISAAFGVLAIVAEKRAHCLDFTFRTTKPDVFVDLRCDPAGNFRVVWEARNEVPFECQFYVLNSARTFLTGIPIDWIDVHPTSAECRAHSPIEVNLKKVLTDNTLVLCFTYRLKYHAEFSTLELSRRVERRYQIVGRKPFRIEIAAS